MGKRLLLVALFGGLLSTGTALGQSNEFRDTRAHLGLGIGLFTYYGPIDLTLPESNTNYIEKSDPAVVILASFPIVRDRFYFRGMVGFTNFDTENERELVGDGQNEFLVKHLFFFEPEVVYTLTPGSRSRFLTYVYTGFGGLVADIGGRDSGGATQPGSGIPGPERSVFALPIGAGIDYAFTPLFSIFLDASYRFNFNYVGRNEVQGVNPHNTSLVLAGIRIGLKNPFKPRMVDRVQPIPPPIDIPSYQPPPRRDIPVDRCVLVELNSVFFDYGSVELNAEARRLLDANVEALRLSPLCCVDIKGYTDRDDGDTPYAIRISRQRAEAVLNYYLDGGIERSRMTVSAEGVAVPPCTKDDPGPGCRRNRRVDSIPVDCLGVRK